MMTPRGRGTFGEREITVFCYSSVSSRQNQCFIEICCANPKKDSKRKLVPSQLESLFSQLSYIVMTEIYILASEFFKKDDKYLFKARNSCCV